MFCCMTTEEEEGDNPEAKAVKQQGSKSKKGKGLPPLSRPLICIANDLYAPALRPLREVAEIYQFKVGMAQGMEA